MREKGKVVGVLLCLLFLFGCATTPKYTKKDRSGYGYSDLKVQEDVFYVSFSGNTSTDRQTTALFTLLRCCEVCLDNGYSYFTILSGGTEISRDLAYYPLPTPIWGQATPSLGTTSTIYEGMTYTWQGRIIEKPTTMCVIKCFKEKPSDIEVFDAKELKKHIKEQNNIK